MRVQLERQPDARTCVLHVEGELDIAAVPEVRSCLESAVERGCQDIILDLSLVVYADSSALGLLVWLDRQLAPRNGRVILAGANRDITRILELSGLTSVAPTISSSPNTAAALEGLDLGVTPAEPLWHESLAVPADMQGLSVTRRRVVELLGHLGISEASLFDVRVAVGEALANAVRHGSPGGAEDRVNIDVTAYGDRVVIEIADQGCGYDGSQSCDEDVYASSGRGVLFMRALMDKVEFAPCNGGGTRVTLVKHLPAVLGE